MKIPLDKIAEACWLESRGNKHSPGTQFKSLSKESQDIYREKAKQLIRIINRLRREL